MLKTPKVKQLPPPPFAPSTANFASSASRGTGSLLARQGGSLFNPALGSPTSSVGKPSLLGGL